MTKAEREELIRKMQQEILRTMAKRNCIIAGIAYNENSNNVDEFDICEALDHARDALAVAEPVIREWCAKVAEKTPYAFDAEKDMNTIAAAIREGEKEDGKND